MYRAYTQDRTARINLGIRRRLAPLLRNDRRRIELMYRACCSRCRELRSSTTATRSAWETTSTSAIATASARPMQWSADRNAGFSRANPQQLYLPVIIDPEYHYETVNVEAQQSNPSSLLWWVKRLITLRKRFRAFGRGSFELLRPDNPKVLAFIREFEDERILVVANLSRFVQYVQLDLKDYTGIVPEEVLGRTPFPQITDQPYLLTLGPHGFIWFSLADGGADPAGRRSTGISDRCGRGRICRVLQGKAPLARRFRAGQWDEIEAHPARSISSATGWSCSRAANLIGRRSSTRPRSEWARPRSGSCWSASKPGTASTETISLGLTLSCRRPSADQLLVPWQLAAFARISGPEPGLLCDALAVPDCCRDLLRGILAGRSRRVEDGEIEATPLAGQAAENRPGVSGRTPLVAPAQRPQQLGRRLRRLVHLQGVPPGRGGRQPGPGDRSLPDRADRLPRSRPGRRLHRVPPPRRRAIHARRPPSLHRPTRERPGSTPWTSSASTSSGLPPCRASCRRARRGRSRCAEAADKPKSRSTWRELIGGYLDTARLLGLRTAELHLALAANRTDPAFAPEPFGKLYQRSLYQSMRNLTGRLCDRLARQRPGLPESARPLADQIVGQHDADPPAVSGHPRSLAERPADSLPWRLPSGATALHRQGLRHYRFRGR